MSNRFGEMLLTRRRQMGLSIQQVANTIKIRPQIIEHFEMGDFAAMPQRGYAQGMIASYARFLGLNPREVVAAYFDELREFERNGSVSAGSAFQEGATDPVPRSSPQAGRYLMVGAGLPPSRYGQRPLQAGYVSDGDSSHLSQPARQLRGGADGVHEPNYSYERKREAFSAENDRRSTRRDDRVRSGYGRQVSSRAGSRRLPSEVGSPGRRSGFTVHEGSGRSGRDGHRAVRGSGYGSTPSRSAGKRGRGASSGGVGQIDPRLFYAGLAAVVILIVLVVILLARSCSAAPADNKQGAPTTTTSTQPKSPAADDDGASDSGDKDAAVPSTDPASKDQPPAADQSGQVAPAQTEIKVSLAQGKTSWVEVKVDGTVAYSGYPVGPFDLSYTPKQSFEILVDHPSDVEIMKNGEKVAWDTKTSGVGRLTIMVPQPNTPQDPAAAQNQQDGGNGQAAGAAQ